MISPQVLIKDGDTAVLERDRLSLSKDRGRVRVDIPLVAVGRAVKDGGTAIEVHLTDGPVHRIAGGNPTATEAFLTALIKALPEERDPAGSALVTTEEKEARRNWPWWTAGITVLLAYVGYVAWVGGTHGIGDAFITTLSILLTLIGLGCVIGTVENARERVNLARRGITVIATRGTYPNGKRHGYFTYTDTGGNEHVHFSGRSAVTAHLVHDPEQPGLCAFPEPLAWTMVKRVLYLALSLGILALGVRGIASPYL